MFYRFVRVLLRGALGQFFKQIRLRGAPLVEEGPLLIVCNHPNFALDSMMAGGAFKRSLWFIAKATLFKNPWMARLLTALHVIPVHRRQDSNPDEVLKNDDTFARAVSCLQEGGGLAIFPEGVSKGERRLAPIKTGAARIALQAEAASDFKLGLKLQPLGITYASLREFRSTATIHAGEPLIIAAYRNAYEHDAIDTVRKLTDDIEAALKQLTVEVANADHEALVEKITKLFHSRGSALDDFERMRIVAQNVEHLAPKFPEKRDEIEGKLDAYLGLTGLFRVEGDDVLEPRLQGADRALVVPAVVIGAFVWYLPYRATGSLARRMADSPVSEASLKFALGIAIFSAWALAVSLLVAFMGWGLPGFLVTIVLLPLLGYVTNRRLSEVRLYLWSLLWPGEDSPVEVIRVLRDSLIAELEALRVE